MKELSIEEKAKAYDEVINEIKNLRDNLLEEGVINENGVICDNFNRIFPEIKESEDERTKKRIIEWVIQCKTEASDEERIKEYDSWIAWLKKQGSHQKFLDSIQVGDKVTRNEDGVLVNLSQLDRVAKREEPTYTKVEPKFKVGQTIKKEGFNSGFTIVKIEDGFYYNNMGDHFPFTDQDNWELVEQKPAWSEEDEELYKDTLDAIEAYYNDLGPVENLDGIYKWVKSLKDRIQPKQEWSEEDERMCQDTINWFEKKVFPYALEHENPARKNISWLKSLRPQNRCAYNPYKAVVDSIAEMCKHYDKANHSGLRDFYDNVKVKCKDAKEYDSLYPQNRWKPSDEQTKQLGWIAKQNKDNMIGKELMTLYNDLKKLKN